MSMIEKTIKIADINPIVELYNDKIKNLTSIPVTTALKFAKLIKEISTIQDFYNTQITNIIQEYGQRDDEGNFVYADKEKNLIPWKTDCVKEASEKVRELAECEHTISIPKFTTEDLLPFTEQGILTIDDVVTLCTLFDIE